MSYLDSTELPLLVSLLSRDLVLQLVLGQSHKFLAHNYYSPTNSQVLYLCKISKKIVEMTGCDLFCTYQDQLSNLWIILAECRYLRPITKLRAS